MRINYCVVWMLMAMSFVSAGCLEQQLPSSKTGQTKPQEMPKRTQQAAATSATTTQPTVKTQNETVVASVPITSPTAAQTLSQTIPIPSEGENASSTSDPLARNKAIQLALRNANVYTGEIDGKIGPMTREAIKKFQMAKSLQADGVVGSKTWSELKVYLPEESNR